MGPGHSVSSLCFYLSFILFITLLLQGGGVVEGVCPDDLVGNCTESSMAITQRFTLNPPTTEAELRQLCSAEREVYGCLTKYDCDIPSSVQDSHKESMKACNDRFPGEYSVVSSGVSSLYKTSSAILIVLLSISALLM